MSITNTTYRVFVEKLGNTNPSQFIGNEGEVFYDPDAVSPSLKLSNGSTPGGVSFAGGGSGGNANTGDITFNANYLVGTGTTYGGSGLFFAPGPDFVDAENEISNGTQYVRLRGGDTASHIHFDTADNSSYDWYFGDDSKYVLLSKEGDIKISASGAGGSGRWRFKQNGTLNLPGGSDVGSGSGTYLSSVGTICRSSGQSQVTIYTASETWMTTVKLLIQAEGSISSGGWQTQATELLIIKSVNGPSIQAFKTSDITTGGIDNDIFISNYFVSLVDGKITVNAEPINTGLIDGINTNVCFAVSITEIYSND
jgi:hypothetical protein